MAARRQQPLSRGSSSSSRASGPRFNPSRSSNPNVFSDDYALEPLAASTDSSPVDPFSHAEDNVVGDGPNRLPTSRFSFTLDRAGSDASSISVRRSNTEPDGLAPSSHRSASPMSTRSNTISDTHRTLSTSSRFSMPRSQSPYVGATGPSHPYGMYPQVTRASSVASASTLRPVERAFVPANGPEHPYAMYAQNTVPEEDDGLLPTSTIPVGFPGMSPRYHPGRRRGDDIGDIVGVDGHVEELPPYTRYADDLTTRKEVGLTSRPVADITLPPNQTGIPLSAQSSSANLSDTGVEINQGAARNAGSDKSSSLKERWMERSQKRVCCGLPLWVIFFLLGVMIFGAVIGGVIGGVVGSRRSTTSGDASDPDVTSPTAAVTVTQTTWLDGAPLPTILPVPNIPTGHWNISTNYTTQKSNACVANPTFADAWGCEPPRGMGITLNQLQGSPSSSLPQVIFDLCPVNSSFIYGPQPPSLHGRTLSMTLSTDKDDAEYGQSFFLWTAYDKLTILPEDALTAQSEKRSIGVSDLMVRDDDDYGSPAQINQKPWFCHFPDTILELFIYVNQSNGQEASESTSQSTSQITAAESATPTTSQSATTSDSQSASAASTSAGWLSSSSTTCSSSIPTSQASASSKPPPPPNYNGPNTYTSQPYTAGTKARRGNGASYYSPNYPLLVKIEEKRKPSGNTQPYCEQMIIQSDLSIAKLDGVAIVNVTEIEQSSASPSSVGQKREIPVARRGSVRRRDSDDAQCVCEWLNS